MSSHKSKSKRSLERVFTPRSLADWGRKGYSIFRELDQSLNANRGANAAWIAARPAQLKAFLADFEHDEIWNPWLQEATPLRFEMTEKSSGLGAKIRVKDEKFGWLESEIIDVRHDYVARQVTLEFPVRLRKIMHFHFDEADGRTRLGWHLEADGEGIRRIASAVSPTLSHQEMRQAVRAIQNYFS